MKFLILLIICTVLAQAKSSELLIKVANEKIQLVEINKSWISKDCLKKSCLANQKPKKIKLKKSGPWIQNPAAVFCESNGGKYLIGVRENGNEDGICRFKDNSAILAWDFYKRNSE